MKYNGIVLLGLGAFDVNIMKLWLYRQNKWAIWTMNDFWLHYPQLVPDRAYQIHKDADEHIDEFGHQRDARGFPEYCEKIGVKEVIHDMSAESYSWYFGKYPRQWYQSTVNYMFADAWRMIENGEIGARIALEGMPFIGKGERDTQKSFVMSAIEMSILRGVDTYAPYYEQWIAEGVDVDWKNLQDIETYGLTQRDFGVVKQFIMDSIATVKKKIDIHCPDFKNLSVDQFKGFDPSDEDAWEEKGKQP